MAREMKGSGIEWIGEIPKDWEISRLQWNLEEINVSNLPIQTENILSLTIESGVIPYEEKGNQGNKAKENLEEYKVAFPDTLVVNSMNVIIGAVGISQYYGCVSPVYYVFKSVENTDLRYIYYLFTNVGFQKEMRKYAKGILEIRLRISSNDMLKRMIPKPPYNEQKKIADFLDIKCAELDKVLVNTRTSIEEYKKLKQAIITQAVTKGVRGDREMKDSGNDFIGMMPCDWEVCKFGRCVTIKSNLVAPGKYLSYPQIAPDNIEKGSARLLNNVRTVEEVGVISWNHLFHKGQIIYSKIRPMLNKLVIAPFDGLCSADMYPIETENDTEYIAFLMLSDLFLSQVGLVTINRVKMPKINQIELANIRVPLPEIEEQREIAEYLKGKCMQLDEIIDKKEKCLTEIENYKKSLIYEYVTGKKEVL